MHAIVIYLHMWQYTGPRFFPPPPPHAHFYRLPLLLFY